MWHFNLFPVSTDPIRLGWWYRQLSDRASGTPRQILFLELAKAINPDGGKGWRPALIDRIGTFLLDHLGPARLSPLLNRMGLTGLAVYRHTGMWGARTAAAEAVSDGLLCAVCVLAAGLAAGFDGAAVVLMGVCALFIGALVGASRAWLATRRRCEELAERQAVARDDPRQYPPEGATSLALIAAARGLSPAMACLLAERVIHEPDLALNDEVIELLCLRPEPLPRPASAAWRQGLGFALGVWLGLFPPAVSNGQIALLAGLLLALGLSALLVRWRPGVAPWRPPVVAVLAGGVVFAVIALLAWLL